MLIDTWKILDVDWQLLEWIVDTIRRCYRNYFRQFFPFQLRHHAIKQDLEFASLLKPGLVACQIEAYVDLDSVQPVLDGKPTFGEAAKSRSKQANHLAAEPSSRIFQ